MQTQKNILIIGASSGIGHECAKLFASFNHKVIGISRENAAKHNNKATYEEYEIDITDFQHVSNFINSRNEAFDVIIYSAGVDICCSALEDSDTYEYLFKVNFFGFINICNLIITKLNKNAIIIPISSVASFLPIPYQSFYVASKVALNAYTLCLNNEYRNIRFSLILPGGVSTGFSRKRAIKYKDNHINGINQTYNKLKNIEQNGLDSKYVAKKIYLISLKKHPKLKYIIGYKYKLYYILTRLFPLKIIQKLVKVKFNKTGKYF